MSYGGPKKLDFLGRPKELGGMKMRIKTGIDGLDKMLHGGFIKGRSILLSGPAGSGKTTFAVQFAYAGAMKYKEKSLYVTLEESKQKIVEDMANFGFDLKKAERSKKLFVIGGPIAQLFSSMQKVDANVMHIIKEIEELVKEEKIQRVVIDSINLFTMLLDTEREKREALASLVNTLSSLGCTTIFTSETEEGSMKLSKYGIEEFIVDGVVVLYLIRQGSKFIPGIAVRKMRGSNHDKEIRVFTIKNKGVTVYPKETMFGDL